MSLKISSNLERNCKRPSFGEGNQKKKPPSTLTVLGCSAASCGVIGGLWAKFTPADINSFSKEYLERVEKKILNEGKNKQKVGSVAWLEAIQKKANLGRIGHWVLGGMVAGTLLGFVVKTMCFHPSKYEK